jgi:hypothetical protein
MPHAKSIFFLSNLILALSRQNSLAAGINYACDSSTQIKSKSSTITSVVAFAKATKCKIPDQSLCLVYDIDNTLLSNGSNFGGEAWNNWQERLDASNKNKVTNWFKNGMLYQNIGAIRYLMNFHLVESITATTVTILQNDYSSIALTSRGFSSFATTERQLAANNINFSRQPIGSTNLNNPLPLAPSFLEENKFKNDLSMYYNGIYYVAGGSKGKNLLKLINYYRKYTNNPKLCSVIIMYDDTVAKIDEVESNLRGKIGYIGIQATHLNTEAQIRTDLWDLDSPSSQASPLYLLLKSYNK